LIANDVSDLKSHSGWAILRPTNPELTDKDFAAQVIIFKQKAIQMLYQLADCTVGLKGKRTARVGDF
jgi:hypothetical protein